MTKLKALSSRLILLTGAVVSLALMACSVTVVNDSSRTVREFYISPAGAEDFGENLLTSPIAPGDLTVVVAAVPEGTCSVDIHYVGTGDFDWYERGHEVCGSDPEIHITD
jgi:hypothetical protein